jgi:hypothetical protein
VNTRCQIAAWHHIAIVEVDLDSTYPAFFWLFPSSADVAGVAIIDGWKLGTKLLCALFEWNNLDFVCWQENYPQVVISRRITAICPKTLPVSVQQPIIQSEPLAIGSLGDLHHPIFFDACVVDFRAVVEVFAYRRYWKGSTSLWVVMISL